MASEIRIGTHGLPEEEERKLPFLLKWVRMGMTTGEWEFRMAEEGEPVDCLLVAGDRSGQAEAAGSYEIPVASDSSELADPETGLTYPLRVADLQRCLEQAITSIPEPSYPSDGPSPSEDSKRKGDTAPDNPEPGPEARRVDRLLAPLLEPEPGKTLILRVREGLDLEVRPDRGYRSPLAPGDLAALQGDLGRAQWRSAAEGTGQESADWRPLTQLIWLLAYFGARDGLLPRIPRDRAFTLKAWPDYRVIPVAANNLRVWAYLTWNTADAATIAQATGVAYEQVVGSLNAGYLCGLVQLGEVPDSLRGAQAAGEKGVLAKIRKRLGLPSTSGGKG